MDSLSASVGDTYSKQLRRVRLPLLANYLANLYERVSLLVASFY